MFFDVRSLLLCDGALVIDDVLALIYLHTSSHGMLFLFDASIVMHLQPMSGRRAQARKIPNKKEQKPKDFS